MKKYFYLLFLLFIGVELINAEDLSLYLIPSEDELLKLLVMGEINFEQYQNSLEIINLYQFDNSFTYYDFYNLISFDYNSNDLFSPSESEQVEIFTEEKRYYLKGSLSHSYATEIEKKSRSRYRSAVKLDINNRYRLNLKIQKEYSGRERINYRNFIYRPNPSKIKQLTVGNFTQKFGLGGVYGYRGKLFDYSSRLDGESFLYPDYGGFNGYLIQTEFNDIQLDQMMSVNRDSNNALFTMGTNLKLIRLPAEPYLTISYTNLKNRKTANSINDLKLAVGFKVDYQKSYSAIEFVTQNAYQKGVTALLGEGVHRFENGNFKYAFWYYADDYLDFTGGGKAVYLTSHIDLDTLDFVYSDRRVGQKGGSVRTAVLFMPRLQWSNAFLYGAKNSDSLNLQYQSELAFKLNARYSVSLKHLRKHQKRLDDNPENINKTDNRIELSYKNKSLGWRAYLSYRTDDRENDYLSFLATMRYHTERLGQIQLWANLYQINTKLERVDYWYLFIKNEIKLYENWFSTVKLSHTYNRRSDNKDITVLSMEIIRVL